jgi:glycogen debranching enzyme
MAAGMNPASATNAALGATLAQLNAAIPALYLSHADAYKKLLDHSVSIETPDKSLDEAFQWAVVSIEQLKARPMGLASASERDSGGYGLQPVHSGGQTISGALAPEGSSLRPTGETALVAGYYTSADSARPGFGWFFGRDALYTLYAVNGYGDFSLSKSELEFLIHRQRADGKIMHEYSQTAAAVDWQAFPYMYAAADSTPLFLMAVADYVRASGDTAFLTAHRDAIEKAWAFETDPAHDTDHDGIYDNSQGTGWVESWPGGMPHQEIYLALLDQQASSAVAYIERGLKDSTKAESAEHRAGDIASKIEKEYYDPRKGCYAFSHNADSSQDRTTTVYPALAWWDGSSAQPLVHPDACLRQFASASLNTDWGLRDVSNEEKIYDGMSYHQGSVWPLFTGWAALAEYRGNQPLAGYQLLKENANLTRAQDLGADTELLSGDFFVPFGRSTSHQLWSSAMVITPTLRGLFGISIDAQSKTITVNPHLPPIWPGADVKHLALAGMQGNILFRREDGFLRVLLDTGSDRSWKLQSDASGAKVITKSIEAEVDIPYPPVDLAVYPQGPPLPGSRTAMFRVLNETYADRKVTIEVEGLAGTYGGIDVTWWTKKSHEPHLTIDSPVSSDPKNPVAEMMTLGDYGANPESIGSILSFHFPPGTGFQTITVTLTW